MKENQRIENTVAPTSVLVGPDETLVIVGLGVGVEVVIRPLRAAPGVGCVLSWSKGGTEPTLVIEDANAPRILRPDRPVLDIVLVLAPYVLVWLLSIVAILVWS